MHSLFPLCAVLACSLSLPQPTPVGINLVTTYTQPPGVTGVTCRARVVTRPGDVVQYLGRRLG